MVGLPAARKNDLHLCPKQTPGTPPVPHVGGPITSPCVSSVIIVGSAAAVKGDTCTCVGPPDSISKGSSSVFIGKKQAARSGDPTKHGGRISSGASSVFIGG